VAALDLTYSSGTGNGIFGYGWNLPVGQITRKTSLGVPRYFDAVQEVSQDHQDTFILAGSDDLVPELSFTAGGWTPLTPDKRTSNGLSYFVHRYRPRVETTFQRVERWISQDGQSSYWKTISGDNVTSIYGSDDSSRVADPYDLSRVFSWLLSEVLDDKGGRYVIQYKPEDSTGVSNTDSNERNRTLLSRSANRYPKRIYYGNAQSTLDHSAAVDQWFFQIVFDYGEHDKAKPTPNDAGNWPVRRDPFSSYTSGFEIRTYRLCQRILMFHNFPNEPALGVDCLVKSTSLIYGDVRGSPDPSNLGNELGTFLTSMSPASHLRTATGYHSALAPPIDFSYSFATIDNTIHDFDSESQENLPYGIDEKNYKLVDLDGEGIPGVLSETVGNGSLMYKPPLGSGRFGTVQTLPFKPNFPVVNDVGILMDLERDGSLDVVLLNSYNDGFSRRTWEDFHPEWLPFKKFLSIPQINWSDKNLRFIDLTGDGQSDVLITEDDVFTWYQGLGPKGFSSATRLFNAANDEDGPRLVFSDALHCIFLADMSGDGLVDIVRIRYGEVSYWPSLGYGHFGKRISMDHAPWPDTPDEWDPKNVLLADIDGNGLSDLIYLGKGEVSIYRNQSGNTWSVVETLPCAPVTDNQKHVQAVDLFGTGTVCLLWSSPNLPSLQTMQYIDLMSSVKPNLLTSYSNNIGTEVEVYYASSTKFYLQDKVAGTPWISRIPFPVQVVEKSVTLDHIGHTIHSCKYIYHHGNFDGREREFHGFGMVEQFDTEHFDILDVSGTALPTNVDPKSNVPPVLTKTWYHTGLWMGDGKVSTYFREEYWKELGGLSDDELVRMQIADTQLPTDAMSRDGITHPYAMKPLEAMEACRALRGLMLRQEVFALDGTAAQPLPYAVYENNFFLNLLQPRGNLNHRSVFIVKEREAVHFSYERFTQQSSSGQTLCSPNVSHDINLVFDAYGNVVQSVHIVYGQRSPDADPQHLLTPADLAKQSTPMLTYNEYTYTNSIDSSDIFRVPLVCESRSFELRGITTTDTDPLITNFFSISDIQQNIVQASDGMHDLPFGDWQGNNGIPGAAYRRLLQQSRTLYQKDDLTGSLLFANVESRALIFQQYTLALTPQLLKETFIGNAKISPTDLSSDMTEAGYLDIDNDGKWWIPSGRFFYSPTPSDTPLQELQYALRSFFLPLRYRNPFYTLTFNTERLVTYDSYLLLPQETVDARGNRVTAGQRDPNPANPLIMNGLDYRLLTPFLTMDSNQNMTAFAFDILGMLAGTAVMGKPGQHIGDNLNGFVADLSMSDIAGYFADPITQASKLLGNATTRWVLDIWAYSRSKTQPNPSPCILAQLSRETHVSDLTAGENTRILQTIGYSDGLGRNIQSKTLTEPGPVPQRDAEGSIIIGPDGRPVMTTPPSNPRWVGTGWVVYNNKQLPIRQYQPFFTDLSTFEFDAKVGVSSTLFYDPLGRSVATLNPDHTWSKISFSPWQSSTWDQNDTVISDPKADIDVGGYFALLPDTEYLPTWYDARIGGALGTEAQQCAQQSAIHASTPSVSHLDPLGRMFLTVVHNKFKYGDALASDPATDEFYVTRKDFDIQGNTRQIFDSKGRQCGADAFDMASRPINHATMDYGERWTLPNITGQVLYAFDDRGFRFHYVYDELQRMSQTFLQQNSGTNILFENVIYGDRKAQVSPEVNNVRLKAVETKDQAGTITTGLYDFKGNLLNSTRVLAADYRKTLDWDVAVPMEGKNFTTVTTYNALNHPVTSTLPDETMVTTGYDLQSHIQKLDANLQGSPTTTPFISNISYMANDQRESISHGNGVLTTYEYDWFTKRLTHLVTRRNALKYPGDCPQPSLPSWPGCQIQSLFYTTDPVGNTTNIRDDAQQTIFFRNQRVQPSNYYVFDAVYRQIEAGGREHLGQIGGAPNAPTPPGPSSDFGGSLPSPSDGNAMGTYVERYFYDSEENITALKHLGSDPVNPGWTRTYNYAEISQLEPGVFSNRLTSTTIGAVTENYGYDLDAGLHGNMTSMPHLSVMSWDSKDQLHISSKQNVTNGGTPETTYYVYDAGGRRVRKATENYAPADATPTQKSQTLYFNGLDIYSQFAADGSASLTRESVHILDGTKSVAIVENQAEAGAALETFTRYQFSNNLSSVALELDDTAAVISYEEFTPYGSTSYFAVGSTIQAPKRYRYTGKERDDEETGFYYYGARYYAHWLGRWTSSDPGGFVDGLNPFVYAKSNPIRFSDQTGFQSTDSSTNSSSDQSPKKFQLDPSLSKLKVNTSFDINDAANQAKLKLDPATAWGASNAQGIGAMSIGTVDVELNNYWNFQRSTGLGQRDQLSGGLQNLQGSLRGQISGAPGLDLGVTMGGSYTAAQGDQAGTSFNKGFFLAGQAHFGAHFTEDSPFGIGLYAQAGSGAVRSGGAKWVEDPMASVVVAGAWEKEKTGLSSVAINGFGGWTSNGSAARGPNMPNTFSYGAMGSLGFTVNPKINFSVEGVYTHITGTADASGQSASSNGWKVGGILTLNKFVYPGPGRTTQSISPGFWGGQEYVNVTGHGTHDNPTGSATTTTFTLGVTGAWR
jgi:RHS repeat-associated protein